jgi:hypothetical protein
MTTTPSPAAVRHVPNRRTRTEAKRHRRGKLHAGRYATAPDAAGRLVAAIDRARAGIANSPSENRGEMADHLASLIRRWCETRRLP